MRTYDVKYVIFEKIIGLDDSTFDVTKCVQRIEIPEILYMCAKGNEQPSIDIRTMVSYLLVMPGRDGSKAAIPTPNIRADPSHLIVHKKMYVLYVQEFLTRFILITYIRWVIFLDRH